MNQKSDRSRTESLLQLLEYILKSSPGFLFSSRLYSLLFRSGPTNRAESPPTSCGGSVGGDRLVYCGAAAGAGAGV